MASNGRHSAKSNGTRKRTNTNASKSSKKENLGCARKFSAVLTRLLFMVHSGLAIWRVSLEYPKIYLCFLCIGIVLLFVEMVITLVARQGREYKWFCPSVFFYLLSVVPCLWFLELSQLKKIYISPTHIITCQAKLNNSDLSIYFPLENGTGVLETNETKLYTPTNNRTRRNVNSNIIYKLSFNRIRRDVDAKLEEDPDNNINTGGKRRRNKGKKQRLNKNRKPVDNTQNATESMNINNTGDVYRTNYPDALFTGVISTTQNSNITTKLQTTKSVAKQLEDGHEQSTSATVTVSSENPVVKQIDRDLGKEIKDTFNEFGKNTVNLLTDAQDQVNEIVHKLDILGPERWLLALHQCLLFVLVIGRWLLPKGEITKDQLSQLLLVFIGVGADILEFVTETIENEELGQITCNYILFYVIYGVWSWSLFQFTLVLTAAKSRKTRVGFNSEITRISTKRGCCADTIFNNADLWGILATMFLQDAPFLATRLYIMVEYRHIHQMMIFFTIKNLVVVLLQIYRIIVIQIEHHSGKNKDDLLTDEEMQPLKGTLSRLARQATVNEGGETNNPDIKTASFKRKKDGSMTVKLVLKDDNK